MGGPGAAPADAELLAQLRAGDEAAFAALVRRYQPSLLRLAQSLVGTRAVAEEVVQDTWLGVVKGVERFEGRSSFKTWLFRILVNRARTAGQREHRIEREPAVSPERFDQAGAWRLPPEHWSDSADDRLVAEQLARRVRTSLDDLPDLQRQVVILRDVEGLPADEVCGVLGVSDGHMRVLLHRGRAKVRSLLEAEVRP